MDAQNGETLDKKKILSYTAKKRAVIATAAVILSIVALCFVKTYVAVTFIAIPIIVAAAFVADKILIIVRPDIYGSDMLKRGRTPVIATCTVVAVFTAICLISGIVGYQIAMYTARNANVVDTFDNIDDAVDYLQTSGLSEKYTITVHMTTTGREEYKITADFSPKSGEYDLEDFSGFKDVEENEDKITVKLKAYTLEYNGEKIAYYVLNEKHLNAKIEIKGGVITVVDYGQAFGLVLGAAFGAAAQIAIIVVVYIAGIIAAIVPSEIYFEKLIRNEARRCDPQQE